VSIIPFYNADEASDAIRKVMGKHYRSDTEGGPLGFLQALWKSARWCQWVEPSVEAQGEGKGVFFYRNRNGLGTAPEAMSAPVEKVVASKGAKMEIGPDDANFYDGDGDYRD
jgi:omega-6 fatty acid desaturase (delta-12 desaturase)